MVQAVHADALKKREEELAVREMNLLGREINIIIQVKSQNVFKIIVFINIHRFVQDSGVVKLYPRNSLSVIFME